MFLLRTVLTTSLRRPTALTPAVRVSRCASLHTTPPRMSAPFSAAATQTSRPAVLAELAPVFTDMHDAKVQKGVSFEQIAKAIGRSEWYTAAIFYGQAKPEEKDLKSLSDVLGVPFDALNAVMGPHFFPTRGLGEFPPQGELSNRL